MTITEALDFIELYQKLKDQKLSFQTLYKLAKFFKDLSVEQEWYKAELNKIINEYAELDDSGNPIQNETGIQLKPEGQHECLMKLNELQNIEVDLQLPKFEMKEFDNLQNLTLDDISKLLPLITE